MEIIIIFFFLVFICHFASKTGEMDKKYENKSKIIFPEDNKEYIIFPMYEGDHHKQSGHEQDDYSENWFIALLRRDEGTALIPLSKMFKQVCNEAKASLNLISEQD